MKLKLYTLLSLTVAVLLFACKSASKLYEKGNYDEAVETAAKKLQKKPGDPELIEILQNAYRYAVNDHESRIRSHSQNNSELRWEWMYNEYVSLQKLYNAVKKSPSVAEIVKPFDYSSYLGTYAEKAGDARFERGMSFMDQYSKQGYKNAYREFQASLRFQPGRMDALQKRDEAFENAVTNVVVAPMQQQGGFVYSSYTVGGNNFDDQLIRSLQHSSGDEFVRFYSAWDARSRNIRVDQELEMRLVTVDIGRHYDDNSTRRVSKDIVVKEIVYRPDSIVKEYAKVHANITTTRRTMQSAAILQLNVRDENGRRIWSDNIDASHVWSTDFATYSGDARALSESDKQLVERRRDFAPGDNEIMRCLLEQLNNDVPHRVRHYFSRY
jgi:hypothetical protein